MLEVSPSKAGGGFSEVQISWECLSFILGQLWQSPNPRGSYLESRLTELYKTGFGRKMCG